MPKSKRMALSCKVITFISLFVFCSSSLVVAVRQRGLAFDMGTDGSLYLLVDEGDEETENIFLRKYRPDQSLDNTFGQQKRGVSFSVLRDAIHRQFTGAENISIDLSAVKVLPSGEIAVAGSLLFSQNFVDSSMWYPQSVLVRVSSAGDVLTNKNGSLVEFVRLSGTVGVGAMQTLKDGKILVAGSVDSDKVVLIRYLKDGSVDAKFGSNGVLDINLSELDDGSGSVFPRAMSLNMSDQGEALVTIAVSPAFDTQVGLVAVCIQEEGAYQILNKKGGVNLSNLYFGAQVPSFVSSDKKRLHMLIQDGPQAHQGKVYPAVFKGKHLLTRDWTFRSGVIGVGIRFNTIYDESFLLKPLPDGGMVTVARESSEGSSLLVVRMDAEGNITRGVISDFFKPPLDQDCVRTLSDSS